MGRVWRFSLLLDTATDPKEPLRANEWIKLVEKEGGVRLAPKTYQIGFRAGVLPRMHVEVAPDCFISSLKFEERKLYKLNCGINDSCDSFISSFKLLM